MQKHPNRRQDRWLERAARFLRRENLHRVLASLGLLSLVSAVALAWLEPDKPFTDWMWWSVVTLTTVGYGDITPSTIAGRFFGIVLMLLGIGILSTFTATIASFFVERKLKKDRGMGSTKLKDHIILCEWNRRAHEIVSEWRSDPRTAATPIVLLADIDRQPIDDERFFFIRGEVNEENLERANLAEASTVVILGDDRLEGNARDARVVLSTLTVESMRSDVYTIAELLREANVRHCERAHADEIIVSDEFSSRLIASAATDHGISKVLSELLSTRYGSELRHIPLPEELVGSEFLQSMERLKTTNRSIAVAVQRGDEVKTNPPADYRLEAGDHLIVIAEGED